MGAVDTNVLVRLLVADDPAQAKRAMAFLEARRPIWISTVVLVETVWVLMAVYLWSKAQILAMLLTATNSHHFPLCSTGVGSANRAPSSNTRSNSQRQGNFTAR